MVAIIHWFICMILFAILPAVSGTLSCEEFYYSRSLSPGHARNRIPGLNISIPKGSRILHFDTELMPIGSHHFGENYSNIRQEIVNLRSPKEVDPEVSLYYASGADASLNHELFPDSKISITIDNNIAYPLTDLENIQNWRTLLYGGVDFSYHQLSQGFIQGGTDGQPLGPSMLISLSRHLPVGSRLRGIDILIPNAEAQQDSYRSSTHPAVHIIVEYDRGEGLPPQWHWHVDATLPNQPSQAKDQWWFQEIEKLRPGVIMSKADSGGPGTAMVKHMVHWAAGINGYFIHDTNVIGRTPNAFASPRSGRFGYSSGALIWRLNSGDL